MRETLRVILFGCLGGISVAACQDSSVADESEMAIESSSQAAGIVVAVNGVATRLEPHPFFCGVSAGGQDFMIRGGVADGDSDPGNNLLTLSISGQRRAGMENYSIQFTSDGGQGRSYQHSISGPDAPFMEGNTFEWSGSTEEGTTLTVEVVCANT